MKRKERERAKAREARGRMNNVARIIVEATADGQLRVTAPGVDPLTVVAMLEFAKHIMVAQQTGPPSKPKPTPDIIIPKVTLPS